MFLDCIVLGDSIAVGVGQARPDCQVVAVTGITSERYVQTLLATRKARTAIISLGVNDGDGVDTVDNLLRLRSSVAAQTVYWLLAGTNPRPREAVRLVAAHFHDRLIDVLPLAGPDHLHPDRTGYAKLASVMHGAGGRPAAPAPRPSLAYRDFPPRELAYHTFHAMKVWNGPNNLNGVPVKGSSARP